MTGNPLKSTLGTTTRRSFDQALGLLRPSSYLYPAMQHYAAKERETMARNIAYHVDGCDSLETTPDGPACRPRG